MSRLFGSVYLQFKNGSLRRVESFDELLAVLRSSLRAWDRSLGAYVYYDA